MAIPTINLEIATSLIGIAVFAGLFLLCTRQADKPNDTPEPRMVPWRILSMAALVLLLLMVARLLNAIGLTTGPENMPFRF